MSFLKVSKDIKRLIANYLDDKDIVNYSIINKEQYSKVCNEQFFKNILLQRYPDTLEYCNISFKRWYLSIIHYVDLLNRECGFDYRKYNEGNPKKLYEIFKDLKDKKEMNELLRLASEKGELSLVKFAVDNGADIEKVDISLRPASGNGHLQIVKYSLDHGADIHAYDDTALQMASFNGHLEIVKYLVEHGANIHAKDDEAL